MPLRVDVEPPEGPWIVDWSRSSLTAKVRQWFRDATNGRGPAVASLDRDVQWIAYMVAHRAWCLQLPEDIAGHTKLAQRQRVSTLARDLRIALAEMLSSEQDEPPLPWERAPLVALQEALVAASPYPLGADLKVRRPDDWHLTVDVLYFQIHNVLKHIGVPASASNRGTPLIRILCAAIAEIHGKPVPAETVRTHVGRASKRRDSIIAGACGRYSRN